MSVRAYLYDASGTDHEITLDREVIEGLHDKQLLWIDVTEFEDAEVQQVARLTGLRRESVRSLLARELRPRLDNYGTYCQFNINAIQEEEGKYRLVEVDFVLAKNLILTIHRQPVGFLQSFDRRVKSDSDLGELNAASFVAALLDWHVTSYFRLVEDLEAKVDKIDAHALRPRHTRDLLSEMSKLRQRVAFVRRVLTPHREVYAAMARPDFQATVSSEESDSLFVLLDERLERAIDAVENARDLLLGSFDMFTTQTTLRTNEVIKILALVSFVSFPVTVTLSISAMLLHTPLNPLGTPGFWLMIVAIVLIGGLTIAGARWRRWI